MKLFTPNPLDSYSTCDELSPHWKTYSELCVTVLCPGIQACVLSRLRELGINGAHDVDSMLITKKTEIGRRTRSAVELTVANSL